MARDPKADPYYNPDFSPEVNEVTNDFVYKKTGKQTTGDAIIVKPNGDSFDVLLIERKRGPHQGGLALPGGFKEESDSVEDFVAREALEETGLKDTDIKQTIDLPTKMDRYDWDVRFADGVDVSGKIFLVDESFVPKAGDDAVSAKFVPVEDIVSGKVDVAFLHSEWIHDTAVELNSPTAPALQEIVDKDRTRNINFMEEINKKRTLDNQPLMSIDKANDNAMKFADDFYGIDYKAVAKQKGVNPKQLGGLLGRLGAGALDPVSEALEVALGRVGLGSIVKPWIELETQNLLAGILRAMAKGGGKYLGETTGPAVMNLSTGAALTGKQVAKGSEEPGIDALIAGIEGFAEQMEFSPSYQLDEVLNKVTGKYGTEWLVEGAKRIKGIFNEG